LYPEHFDKDVLLSFGKPFRIADPGFAIKLFPSQISTHYAITAAIEVSSQIPDKSRIKKLRITAPSLHHIDRPEPVSGLEGKHSLQYTSGVAVLDGFVKIGSFHDERRFRPDIVNLLKKTELNLDASIPAATNKMHMEVAAELDDGRVVKALCKAPKGVWGHLLTNQEHRPKLDDCFREALQPKAADEALSLLDRLEAQDNSGLRKIASLISATAN